DADRPEIGVGTETAVDVVDEGVGYEELAVVRGVEHEAARRHRAGKVADDAILDVERRATIEQDSEHAAQLPIDHQAAQADHVARAGVDLDPTAGIANDDAGLAGTVIGEVEGLEADDRAVSAWRQHADLAARQRPAERSCERFARPRQRAWIEIVARVRHP